MTLGAIKDCIGRPEQHQRQEQAGHAGDTPGKGRLRKLQGAIAGNNDPERLLHAYVEAAVQLVRCATHCFLWRDDVSRTLKVSEA